MNLLPQASGSRPRVACEIAPEGVVVARAPEAVGPIEAVASVVLAEGAIAPGLRPGNVVDRVAVVAALRRALEQAGARPNTRGADISLIVPDGAARVLLLDFDTLPNKLTDALPIVRFRLKKLLPFEADDAMISFQVMSSSRTAVRVLAVAMPRDVLAEYETVAREAGFEPGAVLPSTLARLPLVEGDAALLLVNAGQGSVTTAIVQQGLLLLHRSVDLQVNQAPAESSSLPLVDRDVSAGEWSAQPPASEYARALDRAAEEPGSPARSPYNSPTLQADLNAELHNAVLVAPTSLDAFTDPAAEPYLTSVASAATAPHGASHASPHAGPAVAPEYAGEIARAVSVAAAYFEDTLATQPSTLYCAGWLGGDALTRILEETGVAETDGLRVRDLLDSDGLAAGAGRNVSRSALAGVAGVLRG